MKPIVTVTLSPSLDGDSETDVIRPTHKIRTSRTRFYPAGGGVNVARVITELGGEATPVYCSGGPTGAILDRLLGGLGLAPRPIRIAGDTRVSHAVFERSTGREYRFVPEGPDIGAEEVARVLEEVDALEFDWLVASGSLPASLPARHLRRHRPPRHRPRRPLRARHLRARARRRPRLGRRLSGQAEHRRAPRPDRRRRSPPTPRSPPPRSALRAAHGVALVAVTMGEDGALLAAPDGVTRLPAPRVPVQSATGAGDSFLGAMVFALAEGRSPEAAFALAIAAGAAAVLTYGTDLCHRADVLRLMGEPGGVTPCASPASSCSSVSIACADVLPVGDLQTAIRRCRGHSAHNGRLAE